MNACSLSIYCIKSKLLAYAVERHFDELDSTNAIQLHRDRLTYRFTRLNTAALVQFSYFSVRCFNIRGRRLFETQAFERNIRHLEIKNQNVKLNTVFVLFLLYPSVKTVYMFEISTASTTGARRLFGAGLNRVNTVHTMIKYK